MRYLLISDIHSNLEALETCLSAAPTCEHVVNLGDIVGYGGSPNEVTARARELGGTVIRGNHDKACTGLMDMRDFNPIAGLAALWTMQKLTPENLNWLRSLPGGPLDLPLTNNLSDSTRPPVSVQVAHGSPLDEDEYIIVLDDAQPPLVRSRANLTFFGHTHIQGGFFERGNVCRTLRPTYRLVNKRESFELPLDRGAKYLLNPGSVGQPRDGDRRAGRSGRDRS